MQARKSSNRRRQGATLVEVAIVAADDFLVDHRDVRHRPGDLPLSAGGIAGARGRATPRFTVPSMRRIPDNAAATATDIYNNAIKPMAVGLNTSLSELLGELEYVQLAHVLDPQSKPSTSRGDSEQYGERDGHLPVDAGVVPDWSDQFDEHLDNADVLLTAADQPLGAETRSSRRFWRIEIML